MNRPRRAHELVCTIGADTKDDLVREIRHFASEIERERMSTGTTGGASVGSIYSYKQDTGQTHEKYFEELNAWLERLDGTPRP